MHIKLCSCIITPQNFKHSQCADTWRKTQSDETTFWGFYRPVNKHEIWRRRFNNELSLLFWESDIVTLYKYSATKMARSSIWLLRQRRGPNNLMES